jgi:high-affinity iron transporter
MLFPVLVCAGEIEGTIRLASGIDGGLSPPVVYVAADSTAVGETQETVEVDQVNLQFVPRVQALALGGSIVFRNSDKEAHNVSSQSGCCTFNEMVLPGGQARVRPRKPGMIGLLCNIHQYMRGYVVVCPSRLFAIAEANGHFRISDVPDGTYKLVVWQELSKPIEREVVISGVTRVEFDLEASGASLPAPARSPGGRPVVPWTEVVRRISSTLESACRAAQAPGGAAEAERLAWDAYFEHFEANELETALRLYRGEARVFDLERMFARIRKPLLADLAAGRSSAEPVREAIAELQAALEADVRELHARGVFDRTALEAGPLPAVRPSAVAAVDAGQVLADLRRAFDDVERLAAAGNSAGAASALAETYFQVFHRIEPALAARDFAQVRKIEGRFLELRGRLQSGLSGEAARAELRDLAGEIELAATVLERVQRSRWAAALNGFCNAFVILTREGVEALLIVTAIVLYLNRTGQRVGQRAIGAGVIAALLATGLTWAGLQWLISQAGPAQEAIEGAATLVAAGVLFYVSYWLLSKSEARHWQEFLTRQVGQAVSTGSRWALVLAAFLAVYREGAETILMFQPLLTDPAPGEFSGLVVGVAAASVVLLAVFVGLRFASVRLAIRPFFRVTGALLFVLAVVFAGKGVTELQEARLLAYTPLAGSFGSAVLAMPLGLRDALGLGASIQAMVIQGTLVFGAAISLAAVWLVGRHTPATEVAGAAKPVASGSTV